MRYIAVNEGIDTNRDDNDFAPFKNILNDMYTKDLSRKVKSAKRQRAYKGYYISAQAPYGYKVDPTNRNRLIVDEEAAEVVKEIFRLAIAGHSLSQISRILSERKVITPGVYKSQSGDTRFSRYQEGKDSFFGWCYQTVRAILRDQVYTGDMVNHKVEIVNYKIKEWARVAKEQHIIVADRHEPIVSRDDYERVQSLISLRHRPKKHNFDNEFKDLTFCVECGHRMTLMMKPLKAEPTPLIRCTHHCSNPEDCKHNHAIYYDDLYGELLKRVQGIAKRIENGELLKRIQKQSSKRVKTDKLTANMLNQLIERIETWHTVKVDGCRQQEITIVYCFVGTADEY